MTKEHKQKSHVIFDGEKIIISPDLRLVIDFLQKIEEEIENLLSFERKLESIGRQCIEWIRLIESLSKRIKQHSIEFSYSLSEHPSTLVEKLKIIRPIRAETIAIFAKLEVLFCFYLAYKYKTSKKKELIELAIKNKKELKEFLEKFCLSSQNAWVKKNSERAKKLKWTNLRNLRNSLTHFYAVDPRISVIHSRLSKKARKLEKLLNYKSLFISPEDLWEIVKSAGILMIKEWSQDFQRDKAEFQERIKHVKKIVKESAPVIIQNKDLKI